MDDQYRCGKCKSIVAREDDTCLTCGATLAWGSTNADRFCSKCGEKLASESNVCPKCGAEAGLAKRSQEQSGISGWLLFFVIFTSLDALLNITSATTTTLLECDKGIFSVVKDYCNQVNSYIGLTIAAQMIIGVLQATAVILVCTKSKYARIFCIGMMSAIILWTIISVCIVMSLAPEKSSVGAASELIGRTILQLLSAICWIIYWTQSKRVKNTFSA